MNETVLLGVMLFLGFAATEGTVEYLLGTLFDKVEALAPWKWALMYASAAVGIALAFYYSLDAVSVVFGLPASPVGVILTGIIVGRGSNAVSEVWQRYLGNPLQRAGIQKGDFVDLVDLPEDDVDDEIPF